MCWGKQAVLCWGRTQGLGACNTTELYPSPQSLYCGLKTQVRCIHLTTSWTSQSIRLPARIIFSLFSYSAKQYLCIDFLLNGNILQLSAQLNPICSSLFNISLEKSLPLTTYVQGFWPRPRSVLLYFAAHLVLYHAYLCFFIFGSIPNERKCFIFITDKNINLLCIQAESCTGNYLESSILFFREP